MSWLFASGGQSIGASASTSVLPMDILGWFPWGLGLISLLSKGVSRIFSSTTIWKYQFFDAQPSLWSNSYMITGKQNTTHKTTHKKKPHSFDYTRPLSAGEGNSYPLENSMYYIVHGVAKNWTWLSDFHSLTFVRKWCLCLRMGVNSWCVGSRWKKYNLCLI